MDCIYIYIHTHTHTHTHQFSSVTQSCPTLCNPVDCMQHPRLPYLSPTPGACSNLCPSSRWSHPTISSSVVPFFFCLQSFSASGSFPKSQFFASGGQSIGASASASVLPMNNQDWFPLRLSGSIDWVLLAVQGTLKSLLQHHSSKASILLCSAFFIVQVSHPYMTTGKTIALTRWTFVSKRVRYDWVTFTFNICKMVFMALKVKVAQPCLTLFDPMDSTIYGIFQARTLEWVAISFSRRFSQQRDRTPHLLHWKHRVLTTALPGKSSRTILMAEQSGKNWIEGWAGRASPQFTRTHLSTVITASD